MHSHANPLEKITSLLVAFFFGLAMVLMFFLNSPTTGSRTLIALLAVWIQYTVLAAGICLLVLSLIQFVSMVRSPTNETHPPHDDVVEGDHHAGCAHPHDHEHEACGHDHKHEQHDKDNHDHDHGWLPIRFIPLVVPLILCLMGLPNESMVRAYENALIERNAKNEDAGQQLRVSSINPALGTWNLGLSSMSAGVTNPYVLPLGFTTSWVAQEFDRLEWENWDDKVQPALLDLDMLERIADSRAQHEEWKNKPSVEVEGMVYFGPKTLDGRKQYIRIVRLRVACCLGDASPATMTSLYRSTMDEKNRQLRQAQREVIKSGDWVAVRGRLEFTIIGGKQKGVMRVYEVEKRPIPARPYL